MGKRFTGILRLAALALFVNFMAVPGLRWAETPRPLWILTGDDIRLSPASIAAADSPAAFLFRGTHPEETTIHGNLFGWLPFTWPVKVTAPLYVEPGGESIGILVHTRGVIVSGYQPITQDGRYVDPAARAGIVPGDVILAADGRALHSTQALRSVVTRDGERHRAVTLLVQGAGKPAPRQVLPAWAGSLHAWRLGVAVRQGASGVGTLTFFDPKSGRYAALGHSITDGITRSPIGVAQGALESARVVGIQRGIPNRPGEKIGVLDVAGAVQGDVAQNHRVGLTGNLTRMPQAAGSPVPIAPPDEVHPGPAEMITVVRGEHPETFHIRILRTLNLGQPTPMGMLIQVTDPRLIRETGGIVQGMSGSPILQNGRLVGAVTRVMINRPTLGYAGYAMWMAKAAGLEKTSR